MVYYIIIIMHYIFNYILTNNRFQFRLKIVQSTQYLLRIIYFYRGLHHTFWYFHFVLWLFNKFIEVHKSTHYQKENLEGWQWWYWVSPKITILRKLQKNMFCFFFCHFSFRTQILKVTFEIFNWLKTFI